MTEKQPMYHLLYHLLENRHKRQKAKSPKTVAVQDFSMALHGNFDTMQPGASGRSLC